MVSLREALETTRGNIRSLGPARALDSVPMEYREWLRVVDEALAATCVWQETDDGEFWRGDCGMEFGLEGGTPSRNQMRFCPRCGKPLVERPYVFALEPEDEA